MKYQTANHSYYGGSTQLKKKEKTSGGFLTYSQITLKELVPIESPKLKYDELVQYSDG